MMIGKQSSKIVKGSIAGEALAVTRSRKWTSTSMEGKLEQQVTNHLD